jgi:NADH-ubiquinone oxidoreductase chain 5
LGGDLISLTILSFLVIVAALTKSAQIPFSAWLPAAIAAPTPVSALVHSSTLVTAGVYLLIRFSFLLGELGSRVLMFISIITIFISGVVAIFECDLKKIIALSTLRQLGIIIFAISLGLYQVAFFHLLSHALFKALLFLCAGILIHGVGRTQDVRYFGGLVKNFPLVSVCMNLANFSLCGIPFISGFYSKDLIVELACQDSWGMGILFLMFVCLGLTVLYSVRLSFLAFISTPGHGSFCSVCEQDFTLLGPVATLTFISLLSGPSLSLLSFSYPILIFLPWVIKMGALVVISASVVLSVGALGITRMGLLSRTFLSTFRGLMWFMPWLSGQGVLLSRMKKADRILKILDQG